MKKIIALLLTLVMCMTMFTGCVKPYPCVSRLLCSMEQSIERAFPQGHPAL